MPKINKIRITGAKYDNFRKGYQDQLFDLTRNDEPDHTLFTLVNQGGKGVLMQLISQVTIPGTRWGRESGNQIISMFYDRNRNFRPYTFHVVIEWKLDTIPEKWLITGVCITAEKKFTSEDQEDRTGLNYFHYTIEHDKKGFFSIESLPVYNNKDKKTVTYDEFEKFIDDNGKYIVKYPMSQTRRINSQYFEYLRSRGIYKEEWDVMKAINKHEGGVSSYFSAAADNKSVIDKMIIPAITQNMSNYSENAGESLKDMFLSNLSITRDLPRLLEREGDYRELIVLMSPFIECSGEGKDTQEKLKSNINEGNNILFTLNNSMKEFLDRKKEWEDNLGKSELELEQYNFENDNLEYARYKREEKENKDKVEKIDKEIVIYSEQLSKYKQLKTETEADIILIKRRDNLSEKRNVQKEIQYLIDKGQLKDLNNEILRLEEIIKEKWIVNKQYFEEIIIKHKSYQKQLLLKNKHIDEVRAREDKRLRSVKTEIAIYMERKKEQKKAFGELTKFFDSFRLALPELLLSEIKRECEERELEILNIQGAIKKAEDSLDRIKNQIYQGEVDLKSAKENLEREEDSFNQAGKEERGVVHSLCKILSLEQTSVIYTHSWAKGKLGEIDGVIEQEREGLNELKTKLWEINMDLNINHQEYWMPNSDILSLKQSIGAIGVGPVQTGVEFLNGFEKEIDRKRLVEEAPLLPYGIVIPSQKAWELIEQNLGKDLFLRSAVPVFIRKDMLSSGVKSIFNLGHKMALDQKEFQDWYSGLNKKAENLKQTINALEKKLENLFTVKDNIRNVILKPESNSILKNINGIKSKIDGIKKQMTILESDRDKTNEKLKENHGKLEALQEIRVKESDKVKKLESYVLEDNAIKEKQGEFERLTLAEEEIQNAIDNLDQDKNKNSEYMLEDTGYYTTWKIDLENRLKGIKDFMDNVYLDFHLKEKEVGNYEFSPEYKIQGIDGFFEDVSRRLSLEAEVREKNSQIDVLSERVKNINMRIEENEKDLDKILIKWRDREVTARDELYLVRLLRDITDDISLKEQKLREVEGMSKQIKGQLEQLESSISNVRRRLRDKYNKQAEPWPEEDLQKKEIEIRRNIITSKKKIDSIKVLIKDLDKEYNDINLSVSSLKEYEELDIARGRVDESLSKKLDKEARKWVSIWQEEYRDLKRRLTESERKMRYLLDAFRRDVKIRIKEKILLEKLLTEIQNINIENFKGNLDAFNSMNDHFHRELESTSSDKSKAEQVRDQWAHRGARHIMRIIELFKEMVHGMVYINESGNVFPLIKLEGEEMMPTKEEDVLVLLKEYFVISINKVLEKNLQPQDIDKKQLDELMGDQVLFSRALRGRYPVLIVYKMTEKNEFKYAKPHDYYYASWEAINRGEEGSAEGSGGQRLSICTFMMMMLVNFKKRTIGSRNPWTVLMMDNPFGQASARHILDPIFEIADALNFQIIALAPPELIKIDISKRFPVFWELRIEREDRTGSDLVNSRLVHGGRIILK